MIPASFYEHFLRLESSQGAKEALLSCDAEGKTRKAYTFGQLKNAIESIAWWLKKDLGLAAGEALALALPNSTDLLLVSWAAWASGIVVVPLDTKHDSVKEHVYKIQLARAKAVLATQEVLSGADREQVGRKAKIVGPGELGNRKENKDEAVFEQGTGHVALILFTSGTTAAPKGVELTLENLLVNAKGIADWFGITPEDRFLVLLPLYHINSTTFSLASLLAGASIAVPPAYSNSRFWRCLANTKSTFTSIVPTICYDQLSRTQEFKEVGEELQVNRIQIGSAPVVAADAKEFIEQFGVPLYQGYGQTETALRVCGMPLDLSKELYGKLVEENSIGKAMNWADLEVVDENGAPLGEGKEGEIAVKGKGVMQGYIENPEANEKAFKNGYFLTGDLGSWQKINGTRYFFLKGRLKEIIIKGGVNLSPVAIESRVKEMCRDVDQVFVIGVPDKRLGEEVAALVCYKKSEKARERLQAELKDQLLAPFQDLAPFERPHYVAAITREQIPTTSTGKVQRQLFKELFSLDAFEKVVALTENSAYTFLRLTKEQPSFFRHALALYNHCWHPLSLDEKTFAAQVQNGVVLVGLDGNNVVQGLLTFLRTAKTEQELSKMSYQELTGNLTLDTHDPQGDKVICVSICSSSAKQQNVPKDALVPTPSSQEIKAYLSSGADLVYNFHEKPKGGLPGAELLALLPQARPEDTLALGYAMLVKYPKLPGDRLIQPNENSSLAVQLLEAGMEFAQLRGVRDLYAFSRPAGAFTYFSRKT